MTWSIIARDPATGHVGIAVATRFFAVGARVPHIRTGVGAVCTQAMSNPYYGPRGLALLAAGADPARVVFSGVGKSTAEIRQALAARILCFNAESEAELERISALSVNAGVTANVSLRVNPDVDARTHPYISTGLRQDKFGVEHSRAVALYRKARTLPSLFQLPS